MLETKPISPANRRGPFNALALAKIFFSLFQPLHELYSVEFVSGPLVSTLKALYMILEDLCTT